MRKRLSFRNRLKIVAGAPLLAVLLLVVAAGIPFYFAYRLLLRLFVELIWVPRGRRILLVYSRSPVWQPYIEANWLPRLGDKVVVLNWSDRQEWLRSNALAARVFRHWKQRDNFNPMILMFWGVVRTRRIGLYHAFHDFKKGRQQSLRAAESKLFAFADGNRRPRA